MLKKIVLYCTLIILVLAGCAPVDQETVEQSLELKIKMTMLEPGKLSISTGVHNPTKHEYAGNENFEGNLIISDKAVNLVYEGRSYIFSPLAAGETSYPFGYEIDMSPGSYTAQFSALGKEPLEVQFEIVEINEVLTLVAPDDVIDPHTNYTNLK